jgi:regulatory protein
LQNLYFSFEGMYKKRLTKEQALQKLRFYCRYQQRCQSEVKDKLFELGISKNDHAELIDDLIRENCFDEERFAIAFAIGKFKMKQWGRRKIQYGLKEKRVNDAIIQKALTQIDEKDYLKVLQKLTKEKYASLNYDQYLVRKKKTMDYLIQKGYEAELVKTSVEKITN